MHDELHHVQVIEPHDRLAHFVELHTLALKREVGRAFLVRTHVDPDGGPRQIEPRQRRMTPPDGVGWVSWRNDGGENEHVCPQDPVVSGSRGRGPTQVTRTPRRPRCGPVVGHEGSHEVSYRRRVPDRTIVPIHGCCRCPRPCSRASMTSGGRPAWCRAYPRVDRVDREFDGREAVLLGDSSRWSEQTSSCLSITACEDQEHGHRSSLSSHRQPHGDVLHCLVDWRTERQGAYPDGSYSRGRTERHVGAWTSVPATGPHATRSAARPDDLLSCLQDSRLWPERPGPLNPLHPSVR